MKIVAYNIIILMNQNYQRPKRQIMDVVIFTKLGTPYNEYIAKLLF